MKERATAGAEHMLQLLRAVADETTDAVFVKDRDGKYLFFNEAAARFVGKPVAEVLGRDDAALFDEASARFLLARDRAVMESGESDTRYEELTAAGVTRVYLASKSPYRDADGRVIGLIGISRDVTESRRMQQALVESEERYRRLVDVVPAAMIVYTEGRVSFCNPAFVSLVGATAVADIVGRDAVSLVVPEDRELVAQRVEAMLRTGQPSPRREGHLLHRDGHAVPVHVVSTPVAFNGGTSILIVFSDLTERERAVERLRAVLASVSDAILTATEDGAILTANPAAGRIFGRSTDGLVGERVERLVPVAARAPWSATAGEVECVRHDGTRFPAEVAVTPLPGEPNFTVVVRDIAERRRLEHQVRQAQKMDAVGRLAGGVAHDFNNALMVVNGYCDQLLEDLPPLDANRAAITAIRAAGERATRLTRQLLAFSQKAIVAPARVNVNELVSELAKLLRRLIGADVQLVIRADRPVEPVSIDPGQLEQVIINLALNARDAMPTGGQFTIEIGPLEVAATEHHPEGLAPGRYVELSVADSGTGIPADIISQIFEPFFTTKGLGKGTGLGLSVVHGVVEQSGGRLAVSSTVGQGTTFRIWLPVCSPIPSRPGTAPRAGHGTETILVVEDEEDVRLFARTALQSRGYSVIAARDGAEAQQLVASHPGEIHLVLTDVVMPGMTGRQVADWMRTARPGIKVLYMSGYMDDAVMRHGIVAGRDVLMQKPFTVASLMESVRRLLDD